MVRTLLFTVRIKEKHFERAMDVPSRILWAFPIPQGNHAMLFSAFDINDNLFLFRLSTRRHGTYRKPVLCQALLREFLQLKRVRVDDRVTWYMVTDQDTGMVTYGVRVERKVFTLFGQPIWIDVENLD